MQQLFGAEPGFHQPGVDKTLADRVEACRLVDPLIDDFVQLILEVADLLGALVLDPQEADSQLGRLDLRPAGAGLLDEGGWQCGRAIW